MAPMEQWTVSNECYATAIEDADDALGRAYGLPTAIALDLEWYATAPPHAQPAERGPGYAQDGVVHGVVELPGRAHPARPRCPPGAGTGGERD